MAYKKMTAAEKKAHAEKNAQLGAEILAKGLETIKSTDGYARFLKTASMFHKYSYRNSIMILEQNPEATRVAGFTSWKKMGRFVKKGEKAIKIWAPNTRKVTDEETGEETVKVIGFRLENVFDIAQTDGEDLPEIVNELTEEVENFEALKDAMIKGSGIRYEEGTIENGAMGVSNPNTNYVVVREGLSNAQTIKTIAHEIAHVMLHNNATVLADLPREIKEVQAESVAFIVCNHFGIDTSDYSFGYITGWAENNTTEVFESVLNTVVKTAATIINATEKTAA